MKLRTFKASRGHPSKMVKLTIMSPGAEDLGDALNAHGFVGEFWISVWNASHCCKMISLNNDI